MENFENCEVNFGKFQMKLLWINLNIILSISGLYTTINDVIIPEDVSVKQEFNIDPYETEDEDFIIKELNDVKNLNNEVVVDPIVKRSYRNHRFRSCFCSKRVRFIEFD